jgi:hypothetical protein
MTRIGPLGVVVVFMTWFPLVALAVLLGVAFGWRMPVAFALANGFMIVMGGRPERRMGRIRAVMEFVGLALLGSVVGGLLFGGLGAIVGFVLGFVGRLSEVRITRGPSFRFARRRRH